MAMDAERRQAELIEQFSAQAAALSSSAPQLAALVLEATSHPALFAFSELLSLPALSKLAGTQYASSLDVLRLFAYGTLKDYKSNSGTLPALLPDQVRKLKQLSVLTLAESTKVLPYDQLMQELDVSNVRELEDFLINECMYSGIVRGKLDQLRRCFEVQFASGRDLTPVQLNNMIDTLSDWLGTSDNLLHQIQDKIKWADTMSEVNKKHQKEFEDKVEEAKKSIKEATTNGVDSVKYLPAFPLVEVLTPTLRHFGTIVEETRHQLFRVLPLKRVFVIIVTLLEKILVLVRDVKEITLTVAFVCR
uniref:PCI domain-containing protein n=1 Tax=Leersia perrieri TaxID=77586 RepID=A0A0D9WYZ6_9ORYZ